MTAVITTADEAFANWPTLDEAVACANCRGLFRRAENAICPHCGSESVFDAAAVLNGEPPMLAKLDEVLNETR